MWVGIFCRQNRSPRSKKPSGLGDSGSCPSNGSGDAGFGVGGGSERLRNSELPIMCFKPWGPGGVFGGSKNAIKIKFHVFSKKIISFGKCPRAFALASPSRVWGFPGSNPASVKEHCKACKQGSQSGGRFLAPIGITDGKGFMEKTARVVSDSSSTLV